MVRLRKYDGKADGAKMFGQKDIIVLHVLNNFVEVWRADIWFSQSMPFRLMAS
jgi:hypothetical protein